MKAEQITLYQKNSVQNSWTFWTDRDRKADIFLPRSCSSQAKKKEPGVGEKKDELKNKVEQIKVLEPGRQQRCARMLNSVHWSHGMRNEQAELNHTHTQVLPGPSASHCLASS